MENHCERFVRELGSIGTPDTAEPGALVSFPPSGGMQSLGGWIGMVLNGPPPEGAEVYFAPSTGTYEVARVCIAIGDDPATLVAPFVGWTPATHSSKERQFV